ncbi:MAG: hypothetical protein WCK98_07125 [bacterium]
MSLKTKILSLFLAVLLIAPFLINPMNNGSVKGVLEDKRSNNSSSATLKKGEIAGGVIDYKSNSSQDTQEIRGIAILNLEAKTPVSTNKFPLASEIIVKSGDKTKDLIVSSIEANLPTDVILSLDKTTFESLGGNSATQNEINVIVLK